MGDIMYTVDRIEDSIIILENRDNSIMLEVNKCEFDIDIKEGDILDYIDNKYIKNIEKTENKKKDIRSKFNKLKK
jgi:hypothetical protein